MRFEIVQDKYRKHPKEEIKLPKRATKGSAAYDFYAPCDIEIPPFGSTGIIAADVRCKLDENKVLLLFTRSSNGIKRNIVLKNQVGVIDSDYYNNIDTGGNIGIALRNHGEDLIIIKKGERIMQGMITNFYITEDDDTTEERKGGFGSTGTI